MKKEYTYDTKDFTQEQKNMMEAILYRYFYEQGKNIVPKKTAEGKFEVSDNTTPAVSKEKYLELYNEWKKSQVVDEEEKI